MRSSHRALALCTRSLSSTATEAAADLSKALRLLATQNQALVELPGACGSPRPLFQRSLSTEPLLRGLTSWLLRPSDGERLAEGGRSGRQLRASSSRLLERLRSRSRGFPEPPAERARPHAPHAPAVAHQRTQSVRRELPEAVSEWQADLLPSSRDQLRAALRDHLSSEAEAPAPAYDTDEVAAYAATRLPCTFAVLQRVFAEARCLSLFAHAAADASPARQPRPGLLSSLAA